MFYFCAYSLEPKSTSTKETRYITPGIKFRYLAIILDFHFFSSLYLVNSDRTEHLFLIALLTKNISTTLYEHKKVKKRPGTLEKPTQIRVG